MTGCTGSSGMARRRSSRGRWRRAEDVPVDLRVQRLPEDVTMMHGKTTKVKRVERGIGNACLHRNRRIPPAAVAVMRARVRAAWGLSGCGSWGKRERGSWGLSRSQRGKKRWIQSHGFKSAIKSAVLAFQTSGDQILQHGGVLERAFGVI